MLWPAELGWFGTLYPIKHAPRSVSSFNSAYGSDCLAKYFIFPFLPSNYWQTIRKSNVPFQEEITRKSTHHRCARLTCSTWLTCLTCITCKAFLHYSYYLYCLHCLYCLYCLLVWHLCCSAPSRPERLLCGSSQLPLWRLLRGDGQFSTAWRGYDWIK